MARVKETARAASREVAALRHLAQRAARRFRPREWSPNEEPLEGMTSWLVDGARQDFAVRLWRGPQVFIVPNTGPSLRTVSRDGYFCLVVAGYPEGELLFGLLCWLPTASSQGDDEVGTVHWDEAGNTTAVRWEIPSNLRYDILPPFVPHEEIADGIVTLRAGPANTGWVFRQEWIGARGRPSTLYEGVHHSDARLFLRDLHEAYTSRNVIGVPTFHSLTYADCSLPDQEWWQVLLPTLAGAVVYNDLHPLRGRLIRTPLDYVRFSPTVRASTGTPLPDEVEFAMTEDEDGGKNEGDGGRDIAGTPALTEPERSESQIT